MAPRLFLLFVLSRLCFWVVHSQVQLLDNCQKFLEGRALDGAAKEYEKGKQILKTFFQTSKEISCLLFTLDSEFTLIANSPAERKKSFDYCNKGQWKLAEQGKELCFVFLKSFNDLQHYLPFDAPGMIAHATAPSNNILEMHTTTVQADKCFNVVKTTAKNHAVILEQPQSGVLDKAQLKKTSVENLVFHGVQRQIESATTPPPIILVFKRKHQFESDHFLNSNFKARLVFFSPYEAGNRIHFVRVAGILKTKAEFQKVKKTKGMALTYILRKFGFQIIIVNGVVDPAVLDQVVQMTDKTGASRFTTNAQYVKDRPEFIVLTEKPITKAALNVLRQGQKRKHSFGLEVQILIIGATLADIEGAHVLSTKEANDLAKVVESKPKEIIPQAAPSTPQAAPSTKWGSPAKWSIPGNRPLSKSKKETRGNGVEEAVRHIVQNHPKGGNINEVYVDIAPSWLELGKPEKKITIKRNGKEMVIVDFHYSGATTQYLSRFKPTTLFITNKFREFSDASTKNLAAVYYDPSVYAVPTRNLMDYLIQNEKNDLKDFEKRIKSKEKLIDESVQAAFNSIDWSSIEGKTNLGLVLHAGGLKEYCVQYGAGDVTLIYAEGIKSGLAAAGLTSSCSPPPRAVDKHLMLHSIYTGKLPTPIYKNWLYHYAKDIGKE